MLISTLLVALSVFQPISCWGSLGHRTTAYLAEKYFTDSARHFVDTLLANDRGYDISDAALWADAIKFKRPTTKQWHYIDAQDNPPSSCGVNYKRDCNNGGIPGCVISAITNFVSFSPPWIEGDPTTRVLTVSSEDPVAKKEALMFLIHLIGDIHQPLHTEDASKGGNDIHVEFDGRKENLHGIWDSDIVLKYRHLPQKLDQDKSREKTAAAEWASQLFRANQDIDFQADNKCYKPPAECADVSQAQACALRWASEANCRICTHVLKPGIQWLEHNDLGGDYYKTAAPVVVELVGKAGLRLGAWINALAAAAAESGKGGLNVQGVETVAQPFYDPDL